ncbi:hypothetical protein P7L54_12440 [Acinetobacter bereziniae]|uniref:Uncharacterized protein n=1 Tax=Acinetobacter bereziniae LMG 1003 = CIP 70.12 TaxID=981324 RepID=N9DSZ3_ACIBZ|nr:hypothetical protein [Acinetobacter bereziniae]ENW01037.1 hypothetical protein F938_00553 [Acinetobacter bereziniae LMG 1003 = CIP 70.12]MBJ9907266.1 hypothetical protein [Acinetobacter bereziniae]MBJ9928661.1 hypothetical protein [Acinetobacter bereziniae]MDG3556752.1 hypothetical protein [Acinetobacter bereziniae]MDP5999977.1 hypothetical protein [Acinetobacter bereziniae]
MPHKIYPLLQATVAELKTQPIPVDGEFDSFDEWINEQHGFLHYFELKDYYDNGIEDNFYFKKHNVDTEQLQNEIESAVGELFEQFEDADDVSFEDQMDVMERTEEIIFDAIKKVANQYKLSLLVVYRENPYWMLLPTQDEDQLIQIADAFNEAFNDDGDLNMVVY